MALSMADMAQMGGWGLATRDRNRAACGAGWEAVAFGMSSIGFRVLAAEGWVFGMGWMGG